MIHLLFCQIGIDIQSKGPLQLNCEQSSQLEIGYPKHLLLIINANLLKKLNYTDLFYITKKCSHSSGPIL